MKTQTGLRIKLIVDTDDSSLPRELPCEISISGEGYQESFHSVHFVKGDSLSYTTNLKDLPTDKPLQIRVDFSYANIEWSGQQMIVISSGNEAELSIPMSSGEILTPPVFSLAGGHYTSSKYLVLTCQNQNAQIKFTYDGSEPTDSSFTYTEPILINGSRTIKARTTKKSCISSQTVSETYFITGRVSTPVINLASGTYSEEQYVSISCETENAVIRYTLDGTDPNENSTIYSSPIYIFSNTTLKAQGFKEDWANSNISTAAYSFLPHVADPVFSIEPGLYYTQQEISISCATPGAKIYYTYDGSIPTEDSYEYHTALHIQYPTSFKARAFKENMSCSSVVTADYNITGYLSPPGFNLYPMVYNTPQTLTISSNNYEAIIHYTLDGSEPNHNSPVYDTPLLINVTTTVKAIAYKENWIDSEVSTITITISPYIPTEFVQIESGTFTMGDLLLDDATPTHLVHLSSYYLAKDELTLNEWKTIMNWTPEGNLNIPVTSISRYDILVYCNRRSIQEGLTPCYSKNGHTNPGYWGPTPTTINEQWNAITCDWTANGYRLPTEAEWEYAARGGSLAQNNPYSGSFNPDEVAWYNDNSDSEVHEIRQKSPNELGFYDMSGNVEEWTWDFYGQYSANEQTNPTGLESGLNNSVRGGSFCDFPENLTVSHRNHYFPGYRAFFLGFRLARTSLSK